MGRSIIKHKPISNKNYKKLSGFHPLSDLSLNTGCRIAEIKRLIDLWEKNVPFLDIKTKYSGSSLNRIWLNKKANNALENLKYLKGKSQKTIYREYQKISREINIPFTSHNLRSTFATNMADMGIDIVSIQHLMNHKDISQTSKYIQFSELRYSNIVNMLDDYDTFEGMTTFEMKEEIINLRKKLLRMENKEEVDAFYIMKKEFIFGTEEEQYKEARKW